MLVLLVACCLPSYSLSEVVTGRTNNVAKDNFVWDMTKFLPPQAGLTVEGIFHQYTITKETEANSTVSITNKHLKADGNIYERHDNWNNLPSNTKIGYDTISSLGVLWGQGKVELAGNGKLSDVTIAYQYKFDPCFIPLSDPTCPNFKDALYQYLLDNNLINNEPSVDDPYYDEWVQYQLENQQEKKEEEFAEVEEEEEEELSIETILSVSGAAEKIANATQQLAMMQEMAGIKKLDGYYSASIDGGVYEETIVLEDKEMKDNLIALRNLRQDKTHRIIVRSQYK